MTRPSRLTFAAALFAAATLCAGTGCAISQAEFDEQNDRLTATEQALSEQKLALKDAEEYRRRIDRALAEIQAEMQLTLRDLANALDAMGR